MVIRALSIISVMAILSSCSDGVELDLLENLQTDLADFRVEVLLSPDQICKGDSVRTKDGQTIKGVRNCNQAKGECKSYGDTQCMMRDASLYGVHGKDVKPENFASNTPIAGKKGALGSPKPSCTLAGEESCVVTADQVVVDAATIAQKVPQGSTVASVAGAHDPGYPDPSQVLATDTVNGVRGTIATCTAPGQTGCIANATYKAVPSVQLRASDIRSGVTIGGVRGTSQGTIGTCRADGSVSCLTTTNFPAVAVTDITRANIRTGVQLGGVTGSLIESPATCSATTSTGCVATAGFPAITASLLAAGNIKNGVTIGGVAGQYPSASHPLRTATATVDLTAANFNSRLSSATEFEYFTAAGARQHNRGDAGLVQANIASTVTIFGVRGTVEPTVADCSASLSLNCVAKGHFVSYQQSLLSAGNIKNAATVGGVSGDYPSANHPLVTANSAVDDLSASNFTQRLASTSAFEYFDAKGDRIEANGSAQLTAGNIADGVTILGVTGNFAIRPELCTATNHTACLTDGSFPAYSKSLIHAGVIKKAAKVGLVTGDYPSSNHPLDGASGAADLQGASFVSQIKNTANFEYWDSTGTRHVGQGTSQLTAQHIKDSVTVFGVTGAITEKSPDCLAGGGESCVATASFPAYRKTDLTAAKIKYNHTLLGMRGTYPSASNPLAGSGGHPDLQGSADLANKVTSANVFEFWDSAGNHHTARGSAALVPANIARTKTVFSVAGQMNARPDACSTGAGETACLTTSRYRAYDASKLTAGVLQDGVTLGGVSGKYPSVAFPLAGHDGNPDLRGSSFNQSMTTAGTYNYWDSAGNHQQIVIAQNLGQNDVRTGTTVFGVAGQLEPAPDPCSAMVTTGCLTTPDFPSQSPAALHSGVIKSGERVGSVIGEFPSNAHPLHGDTNTVELGDGIVADRLKNSASFEFWDSAGNHYVRQGTDDIKPANLRMNVNVFGVQGTMLDASASTLQAHQIRHGVTINGVTGTLKVNCRNTSTTANGSQGTIIETHDDYTGGAMPGNKPWGDGHTCNTNIFVPANNNACDTVEEDCEFVDRITGLTWIQAKTPEGKGTWNNVRKWCQDKSARLPTHKEFITAYTHGLRSVYMQTRADTQYKWPFSEWLWTATSSSSNTGRAIVFQVDQAKRGLADKGSGGINGICVR